MPQPLRLCLELPQLLAGRGVGFAHWKSNHHLDAALAGETDLDVLVAPADAQAFAGVMAEAGGIRIQSQPWASYPQVADWLLADPDTGSFIHVHVHEILATGLKRVKHLYLPWTDYVLAHLRQDPSSGWPIPEAGLELLVLLIRIWAKMPPWRRWFSPRVPSHIMAELRWLEAQTDSARLQEAAIALGVASNVTLPFPDEASVIGQARSLYGQVKTHYRMSWPMALWRGALLNLRLLLTKLQLKWAGPTRYRKVLEGRGAMVALIGSDGSGKSTLSATLNTWLRYKLDVHRVYMGSGDGGAGWLNATRRAVAQALRRKKLVKSTASPREAKQKGFTFKAYRLFDLLLLRRKLKYLRISRRLADHGSVILLDRYPQQQFNGISDGPRQQDGNGFAWAARAERQLFDEAARLGPDMVIRLHIDPKTALARKPDHDAAMIARKCAIIDALEFPQAVDVVVDAALAPERVALAAKTAIWSLLRKANRHDG